MRHVRYRTYIFLLFLLAVFAVIQMQRLKWIGETGRLNKEILTTAEFRSQPLDSDALAIVRTLDSPGEILGIYWLETDFGRKKEPFSPPDLLSERTRWETKAEWGSYLTACRAIWDDVEYFPVAEASNRKDITVGFEDSWMFGRSYKGDRGHEGTDIMPSVNRRGLYPVVSMTDGTVKSKGWLELGGYRLGIEGPQGAYFYYAHLDSYAQVEEGSEVKAGDLLGYMGDTGYSTTEGTTGNFPVHLHVGIYIYPEGEEISINPYPVLKYLEERKVSCNFR